MPSITSVKKSQGKNESGPKAYGLGIGARASVSPLTAGGAILPKGSAAASSDKFPKPIVSIAKDESDSGSANTAVLRSNKKESTKSVRIRTHLRESDQQSNPTGRFAVVLIEEGLGNMSDCFFYTKACLQNSASIFEGKKCFADHPSSIEEETRPERSTRDILGHYENSKYVEVDGRGQIQAELVLLEGASFAWAQSLFLNALDYAQKYTDDEFVGLSINASGEAGSIGIDEFLSSGNIPQAVKAKLAEAKAQGITEIRPVMALKDAKSCDLVTEAGAGGKILKMIEQEKRRMGKQKESKNESGKENEKEKKEAGKQEDGSQDTSASDDSGNDDHADADQDKELFQKMISQYLGKDAEPNEESMKMAKAAYEAHKEKGLNEEEAYEAAGNHLQMAAAVGKKLMPPQKGGKKTPPPAPDQSADSADDSQESEENEESSEKEKKEGKQQVPASPGKTGDAMESVRKDLLETKAELARLRESVNSTELEKYLDKKLAESKKPNSFTKLFREALGKPTSKKQIDQSFDSFLKVYEKGVEDASVSDDSFVLTEKNAISESAAEGSGSFADCVS